jgi:hypothetical protein
MRVLIIDRSNSAIAGLPLCLGDYLRCGRTIIDYFCMTIFERYRPAIFAEFQESISEGFFVWAGEWRLLQLQGSPESMGPLQ